MSPFEQNELARLRKQVDQAQDDAHRSGAGDSEKRALRLARNELSDFVSRLRQKGEKI